MGTRYVLLVSLHQKELTLLFADYSVWIRSFSRLDTSVIQPMCETFCIALEKSYNPDTQG